MEDWLIFGDSDKFSFQFRFAEDPDGGQGVSDAMSASWGFFRIFVNSVNLCENVSVVAGEGEAKKIVSDSVAWYLLPMFQWIAHNWNPLFHESSFPDSIDTYSNANTACNVYEQYEAVLCDIETKKGLKQFSKWQKWWKRHALRASSEGGIFPDIFIRRFSNYAEVSWGDSKWPGMPDEYSLAKPGAAILRLSEIAPQLHEALFKALDLLEAKCPASEEVIELAQSAAKISKTPLEERLRLVADVGLIDSVTQRFTNVYEVFKNNIANALFVEEFSPIIVMFGAVSPSIDKGDIESILQWLERMLNENRREIKQDYLVASPIDFSMTPAEDGYNLAQQFLEKIQFAVDAEVDIDAVYKQLDIRHESIELKDISIRAITVVMNNFHPMVAVNLNCPFNQSQEGFRFTLAHELCHILHDREYGKSLAIVSGPWAPIELEKRANAFSAMVLMPRNLIEKKITSLSLELDRFQDVKTLAASLKTSPKATFEHLANIGFINYIQHELMKNDFSSSVS